MKVRVNAPPPRAFSFLFISDGHVLIGSSPINELAPLYDCFCSLTTHSSVIRVYLFYDLFAVKIFLIFYQSFPTLPRIKFC